MLAVVFPGRRIEPEYSHDERFFSERVAFRLAEKMAQLLEREEREAVLGDLLEAGDNGRQRCLAFGFSDPAAVWPVEELAAMAGGVWSCRSRQFSSDGILAFGEPGVSAIHRRDPNALSPPEVAAAFFDTTGVMPRRIPLSPAYVTTLLRR